MATPDPANDGLSTAKDQHERFLAALCRETRLQNEKIHKKRQILRGEVRLLLEHAYDTEGIYWHGYHKRLAEIAESHPEGDTHSWAATFGQNEMKFLDEVAKTQAKLHQAAQRKQEELAEVNREFWAVWRKHVDFMRGLPASSGSMPAAMVPDAAPQPIDDQTGGASSASHSNGDGNQGDSNTASTIGQTQSVSVNFSAAGKPLPKPLSKLSTTTTQAGNAQIHSLGQTTKGLKASAMQATPSNSPFAATTPRSLESSPEPLSHTRRRAMAAAAREKSSVPDPQSLTPKSTLAPLDNPDEPSQDPSDGAQPAKRRKSASAGTQLKMMITPINSAQPSPQALSQQSTPQGQDDGFVGVADPVVGEIYQAFYKDATQEGWWMCTRLPWDAWDRQIGINFGFDKLDLWKDLPEEQYKVDRVRAKGGSRKAKNVITGWKGEYRAGGSKMNERILPMLLFDDGEGEPGNFKFPANPATSFTFPKKSLRALPTEWISAGNLRVRGVNVGVGVTVGGHATAQRFKNRLEARNALREKKMLRTPRKSRAAGSSSRPAAASSPMGGSSAMGNSSLLEEASRDDTSRDDTEMADAESLSGATAVEGDTAGQPDPLETPETLAANTLTNMKSSPITKSSPTAGSAQGRSGKGWMSVVMIKDSEAGVSRGETADDGGAGR
jgi:hypothetical protein